MPTTPLLPLPDGLEITSISVAGSYHLEPHEFAVSTLFDSIVCYP
ncbi:MAG: hypothetical protein ACYDER_10200 [Ktedonobacteraceae bacterium]